MKERGRKYVVEVIASLLAVATVFCLEWLSVPSHTTATGTSTSSRIAASAPLIIPSSQAASQDVFSTSSNVLELPTASLDFVGDWGGFTDSSPSVMGVGPDRVSVIFGRRGDAVFFASELYSPSGQKIIGKPRVRILNPRETMIEYSSEDAEVQYVYSHRFRLLASGRMAYRQSVELYDRQTRGLLGTATQHALLHRLVTDDEKRLFSQPSSDDIHRGTIETTKNFLPGVSRKTR
jgi:hypothetical protein